MTKIEKFEKVRALVRGGLSQSEAARQVGVSHATASRWCADLPKPQREPREAKPKREPEITLTAEQRKNARDILSRLAGGEVEEPKTRRKLSDEMLDEREQLRNYQPRGFEITDEMIKAAHAGITWKDIRRATRNAKAQLRAEVQRGLENTEARARYIRGEFGDSRLKPRAGALEVANAA